MALTALTGCASAASGERPASTPGAAIPCRGGQIARTTDPPADVVNDLHPAQRHASPLGLDLRAAAVVADARRVCATWRLAGVPAPGTMLSLLLYRAQDGGGGVAVEIDVRLTGGRAEVAAGGYGNDQDEFRLLRAEVRSSGDQVSAVVPRRQLPGWSPGPADLVWALTTRDVIHGMPLTDRTPAPPAIGLRYPTGQPCEATAPRCD